MSQLDALSTEELRHRAFGLAEHRHDVRFFWDIAKHLPAAGGMAAEDASAGGITGGIAETVRLARELVGEADLGPAEPLLRSRFLEYLRAHGED